MMIQQNCGGTILLQWQKNLKPEKRRTAMTKPKFETPDMTQKNIEIMDILIDYSLQLNVINIVTIKIDN